MHPFDWGVTKPWGEAILLVTTVVFAAVVWWSVRQWLATCWRSRRWWLPAVPAILILGAMVQQAGSSIFLQMTSFHYQESTHMVAVAAIASGWAVSVAAGTIVRRKANPTMEGSK